MITLQQIIKEMEANVLSAENEFKRKSRHGFSSARTYEGAAQALKKYIPKLTLLLNTENENGGKNEASNGGKPPVSGSASDFERELYKLINEYVSAGLKKPDLVHKMEYVTQSCRVS